MKRNDGYVLIYSLIAMLVSCALVICTVTLVLYYGNNLNRTIGGTGALYTADSGIKAAENYLNAYYIDKGNLKTNTKDLWDTADDIIGEIVPITDDSHDDKTLLVLQGYMNYNYIISAADRTKSLSADESLSGAYRVYTPVSLRNDISEKGIITLLSVGEYVYQGKSYYKFVTVEAYIEPVYSSGIITGLQLRTVDYTETIKGGTDIWGNIIW